MKKKEKKFLPFLNTGAYLKKQRLEAGLTQKDVMKILGFDHKANSYVSMIEKGERCLSVDLLRKLISPLKINSSEVQKNYNDDYVRIAAEKMKKFMIK